MKLVSLVAASSLLVSGLSVEISPSGSGSAEENCPEAVKNSATVPASVVRGLDVDVCALRGKTVVANGVGAVVPAPGTGVIAHGLGAEGDAAGYLEVSVSEGGTVRAVTTPPAVEHGTLGADGGFTDLDEPPAEITAAAYSRCSDYSHSFMASWWRPSTLYLNSTDRRPSIVTKAAFESMAVASLAVWKNRTNSCGLSHAVDVPGSISYGSWTYDSNISTSNTCLTRDSRNVVDFGSLGGTLLGLTCTWTSGGGGVEADVRLDTSSRSWVTTTSGCTGSSYDLRSVLTHELGHVLSISHATEYGGSDLTMSPLIAPCNSSARILGAGDVTALYVKHGG